MNERLKELAEQAGLYEEPNGDWKAFASEHLTGKDLERFADLVDAAAVAREREACAMLCDAIDVEYKGEDVLATWCATAIRSRK